MLNWESLLLKNSLNSNNQNSYLLRNLGRTLFFISVPALFLRVTNKLFYRQVYCVLSSYYIGHSLRKINDDLILFGRISTYNESKTNN